MGSPVTVTVLRREDETSGSTGRDA
jgi:hypothetical protein